jgi:hypothetical protein
MQAGEQTSVSITKAYLGKNKVDKAQVRFSVDYKFEWVLWVRKVSIRKKTGKILVPPWYIPILVKDINTGDQMLTAETLAMVGNTPRKSVFKRNSKGSLVQICLREPGVIRAGLP